MSFGFTAKSAHGSGVRSPGIVLFYLSHYVGNAKDYHTSHPGITFPGFVTNLQLEVAVISMIAVCYMSSNKSVCVTYYIYKYKKQLQKLQKEVGMAMPKSTQTRVVGMITNRTGIPTYHTHAQQLHN